MSVDTKSGPYFDDYDESKNFQKILFKPQFPVQTRELNQMQTLIQKQIERLGNRVLKQGTVVSGCETVPTANLSYVKLKNNETSGRVVDVNRYKDKFVKNAANTVARVVAVEPGFIDQDPDLNTVYVRYVTSGDDGTSYTFNADEVVSVYDPSAPIESLTVTDGSAGFSNGDTVHFLSAVKVANTAGGNTFASGIFVGDVVTSAEGASVVVSDITTDGSDTILQLQPQLADQIAGNTTAWNVTVDSTFLNANTSQTFVVEEVIGSGASGSVVANAIGEITRVDLTASGSEYTILPTVFVTSTTASSSQLQAVELTACNVIGNVAVAGPLYDPIGVGFGVAIDKGLVYQGGYISRTDPQFVVVEKYNSAPSEKSVGFETIEEVITAQDDASLYDNALNSPNYTAPGADRLKVTTRAIALTEEEAAVREDFLPLVKFSEGEPYQTAEQTESSLIDEHLAVRTYEENGDFVVDPFLLTTKSTAIADSDERFKVVVDPGVAYISGYRVATQRNFSKEIDKATTTKTITETVSSTGYGNYIVADKFAGTFAPGQRHTLKNGSGSSIGSVRVKGVKTVGQGASRKYRVYLFDISMNSGQSFKNVRAMTAAGTFSVSDPTIFGPNAGRQIFNAPVQGVKSVDNVSFVYQKSNWGTVTANTSGIVTLVTSDTAENFPIAGQLDADDANQVLISTNADVVATSALAGTINTTAGNTSVTGTGTAFLTNLEAGEYVSVANTTSSQIVQVASIANNTSLTTVTAPTITIAGGTIRRAFKQAEMITPESVTVSGDRQTMTIDLGAAIPASGVSVVANVERAPTVAAKTVTRDAVIRLNLNSHPMDVRGPWAIGHADAIRLKGVFKGSNTTFTSAQGEDVTDHFYLDANHTPESKGTGYLYKRTASSLNLTSADRLLVKFDVLTQSASSLATVNSYPIDDDVSLEASVATVNTMELPEVFGDSYIDTRDAFDFRQSYANTVAIHTTESSAPVNPTEPAYNDRYALVGNIPAPDSEITSTITYYLPRQDRVIATAAGDIKVLTGQPGTDRLPEAPQKAITVNLLNIPPYPSLPVNLNEEMAEIVDTKLANENLAGRRRSRFTISTRLTQSDIQQQQPRRYTQQDIGSLDRRLDAVEYYLSLTAAESQASARFIGSSQAENVNRFKFGFFVDNFVDGSRSEINHPQYAATIENGAVGSKFSRISINLDGSGNESGSEGLVSVPYTSAPLISQLLATDGPVEIVQPIQPTDPTSPTPVTDEVAPPVSPDPEPEQTTTVVQRQCIKFVYNQNKMTSISGRVSERADLRLSSLPGKVELYFNFRDNDNAIEIYQGDTPNFSLQGKTPLKNGLAAQRLTSYDKTAKAYGMGKLETLDSTPQYLGSPPKPSREDAGKILWNHDPSKGRYYAIVVTKYRKSGGADHWHGKFFYRVFYPCDTTVITTTPPFNGINEFTGTMTSLPQQFVYHFFERLVDLATGYQGQIFRLSATGLKPSTAYDVVIEEEDYNAFVAPVGGTLGERLISTAEGRLEFDLYFNYGKAATLTVGNKQVIVKNADNSSSAAVTIKAPTGPLRADASIILPNEASGSWELMTTSGISSGPRSDL